VPLLQVVEAPDVVQAKDMIGVGVGEQHRIDAAKVVADRLLPQLGRRVDQQGALPLLYYNGAPGPLVTPVGRGADGAVTLDRRHTVGGSRAEEDDLHGATLRRSRVRAFRWEKDLPSPERWNAGTPDYSMGGYSSTNSRKPNRSGTWKSAGTLKVG